jgi:hypothetical protein
MTSLRRGASKQPSKEGKMIEALAIELTDYALAASYMAALAISVTATMMVRSAAFPFVR